MNSKQETIRQVMMETLDLHCEVAGQENLELLIQRAVEGNLQDQTDLRGHRGDNFDLSIVLQALGVAIVAANTALNFYTHIIESRSVELDDVRLQKIKKEVFSEVVKQLEGGKRSALPDEDLERVVSRSVDMAVGSADEERE